MHEGFWWQESFYEAGGRNTWPYDTKRSIEHRCQACGHRELERSVRNGWLNLGLGLLTLPLPPMGVMLLILGARAVSFSRRVPVVPDATPRPVRFPTGPAPRGCTCGGSCRLYDTYNLFGGHLVAYQCERCSQRFRVLTPTANRFTWWYLAWLLGLCVAIPFAWPLAPLWALTLLGAWATVQCLLNERRFPERAEPQG